MNIIIDTDALVGTFHKKDPHYPAVQSLNYTLAEQQTTIFLLPTTIAEFVTLATIRMGRIPTQSAIQELEQLQFLSLDITEQLTARALKLYLQQTSKEESLFDCYVMAAAKEIKADAIFSFDKGYQKNGFKLASDVL